MMKLAANLPAAVSVGGAAERAMERGTDNAIRFVCAPELRRRVLLSPGIMVEAIALAGHEHFASAYFGPLHLLIAHERLSRRRGLTSIEGVPDSARANLGQTLTFVPAGRQFREWHEPETACHIIYIHIDPSAMALTAGRDAALHPLAPRLHFCNPVLWQTVLKVKTLVTGQGVCSAHYGNALGVVLTHELARSAHEVRDRERSDGRGLAMWQRRLVVRHVEEHLAERLPIPALAKLARLSHYHFCRSFRQSFGMSPHRYHLHRRAERAKTLLANPALSITEIALDLGFRDTSSFSTTFRKLVGRTPSEYRRSLSTGEA